MIASPSHPLPSLLSRTRRPRPSSNNPHRDLRCGPPPLAPLNPPCLVGSQTAARTCGRKHSSASPLHGHGLLPRGLPETALEEWAPWLLPDPTQAREAHFVVCDDRRSSLEARAWHPFLSESGLSSNNNLTPASYSSISNIQYDFYVATRLIVQTILS